jgi:hypothetical protein
MVGNTAEAVRLYDLAGQELASTNPSLAAECRSRVQWLRDGGRAAASSTYQTGRYGDGTGPGSGANTWGAQPPAGAGAGYPSVKEQPSAPPGPAQLTSLQPATGKSWSEPTAGPSSPAPAAAGPAPTSAGPPPANSNAVMSRSGPGRLYRAPFSIVADRQTYYLEPSGGQLRLYVTAKPGFNLEPYVYHNVELYGPMIYSGPLRTNYMEVVQVTPLP